MKDDHSGSLSSGFLTTVWSILIKSNQILSKMDKQKKQQSPDELDEIRQLEKLIHKKNSQTKALKKLLKAVENDNKTLKKQN